MVKVSIAVITYNHEQYIRKAIESILSQNVNFEYEIVIGDDCSPDSTQKILLEYKKMYPNKFKMILRERNIGATKNLYDVVMNCKGQYIAQLEGDDYWTDQLKLQKQVDFLEENKEYICTSHYCRYVDINGKPLYGGEFDLWKTLYLSDEIYKFSHLKNGMLAGQTSTFVYRNIFLEPKHDFSIIYKAHNFIGDTAINLILLGLGKIYCINEIMSDYRLVRSETGSSFTSHIARRNPYYEVYLMWVMLSKYSLENFSVKLNPNRILGVAIAKFIKNRTKENFNVVIKIMFAEKNIISIFNKMIYLLSTPKRRLKRTILRRINYEPK
ncbi:glycosyltransferase [Neobacillus sp. NPDC093127]|uniref:glycosyltransferase n=1 Tax=Neobacillus sp. NPDC093127 TaxID=3364296 RepID=UPI00381AF47B